MRLIIISKLNMSNQMEIITVVWKLDVPSDYAAFNVMGGNVAVKCLRRKDTGTGCVKPDGVPWQRSCYCTVLASVVG